MNEKKQLLTKWNELKYCLSAREDMVGVVKKKDIWWCAFGENIGVEINGKNAQFSRPALIFRKLSRQFFLVLPLTTQAKNGTWYWTFDFRGKREVAVLSQLRTVDVKRLYKRMGAISDHDYNDISKHLEDLIFGKNVPRS